MDGSSLLKEFYDTIRENDSSSYMTHRIAYGRLYQAACEFTRRTRYLTGTQTIQTIANQANYDMNPDFLTLHMMNSFNQHFIKYNDGNADYWILWRDYDKTILAANPGTQVPSNFCIIDGATLSDRITGTASVNGVSILGECTLVDNTTPFANVVVGDTVHNTTDDSNGIVIENISASALLVALFDGTNNSWESGDEYVIVPQGRLQLVLDPPPSITATITLPYIQKPTPVFSPYRTYRFDEQYSDALVMYAVWREKYRDSKTNEGDAYYKHFDLMVRNAMKNTNKTFNRLSWKFNMVKRTYGDRSMR